VTTKQILDRVFEQGKKARVAVIGDAMTDVYVVGSLAPSQDGCQKFVVQDRVNCAGGAANAALAIGWANVRLFSNRLRPVKTRWLVDGKIVFRQDEHDTSASERVDILLQEMEAYRPDVVLLSDYNKGLLSDAQVQDICHQFDKVVVDASRSPSTYKGSLLKCNEIYAQKFAEELVYGNHDMSKVVVTRGHLPPNLYKDSWHEFKPLPQVTCVNHVGAGDCFAAYLAVSIAVGLELRDAVAVAHCAGAVYVQHPYNRPPEISEIYSLFCS